MRNVEKRLDLTENTLDTHTPLVMPLVLGGCFWQARKRFNDKLMFVV